jgi:hypothetical protein
MMTHPRYQLTTPITAGFFAAASDGSTVAILALGLSHDGPLSLVRVHAYVRPAQTPVQASVRAMQRGRFAPDAHGQLIPRVDPADLRDQPQEDVTDLPVGGHARQVMGALLQAGNEAMFRGLRSARGVLLYALTNPERLDGHGNVYVREAAPDLRTDGSFGEHPLFWDASWQRDGQPWLGTLPRYFARYVLRVAPPLE